MPLLNLLKKLLAPRSGAVTEQRPVGHSDFDRLLGAPVSGRHKALTPQAREWLVSLPEYVWPKQICVREPAITNHLASLWGERPRCEQYFVELLMDNRVTGPDAPPAYSVELIRLESFYRREEPAGGVAESASAAGSASA